MHAATIAVSKTNRDPLTGTKRTSSRTVMVETKSRKSPADRKFSWSVPQENTPHSASAAIVSIDALDGMTPSDRAQAMASMLQSLARKRPQEAFQTSTDY